MRVDNGGIGIEYEVTGEGRPVVLLHGFPDSSRLWRHQVTALADAGFKVIVPDLRGYGKSDKPADVGSYALPLLATDVLAVMGDAGVERAHVVGHDWGAAVAWGLGAIAAIISLHCRWVIHRLFWRAASSSTRSRGTCCSSDTRASPSGGCRTMAGPTSALGATIPTPTRRLPSLEANGSLTPGLNYYRANATAESFAQGGLVLPPIQVPTMGVWSSGDFALTETQMTNSAANITAPWRYERIEVPGTGCSSRCLRRSTSC
jgi:pimeloyl-ACP methyl ester carboxylesterase